MLDGYNDKYDREIRFWENSQRRFTFLTICFFVFLFILFITVIFDFGRLQGVRANKLNWDELLQQNPDTVAWLTLEDTTVDYPIVQGKDNFEYLSINFYGDYYAGGTLFLDADNDPKFNDQFNIIFGHRMSGPAMFGGLAFYKEKKFFLKHRFGSLETPERLFKLEIVSVFNMDAYDNFYSITHKLEDFQYEPMLKGNPIVKTSIDRNAKYVVLSTCTTAMSDERLVVVAKITEDPDWDPSMSKAREVEELHWWEYLWQVFSE